MSHIPGAIWPILYVALYVGLQTFVQAQWPETPPAYVMGAMAALGILQGAVKVLWPAPSAPLPAAAPLDSGDYTYESRPRPNKFWTFLF